ncbi:uncharacterized protein KZ484_021869 [Pholidichthys leucotaenia]
MDITDLREQHLYRDQDHLQSRRDQQEVRPEHLNVEGQLGQLYPGVSQIKAEQRELRQERLDAEDEQEELHQEPFYIQEKRVEACSGVDAQQRHTDMFSVVIKSECEEMCLEDERQHQFDVTWNPETRLHRNDASHHHHVFKEEIYSYQQLFNQESNSSLDPEEPYPPQVKEEEDGHASCVLLNQETDGLMVTEECGESEPETENDQFFSYSSPLSENDVQEGGTHVDLKSTRNHTVVRKYVCHICGRRFSKKRHLLVHVRDHTGEDPFPCSTCEKKFKFASLLEIHMRTHTGEKPFYCETCGKRFSEHSTLKVHMRTHTGEKPFSCETCGKSFSRSCILKVHMRTHSGENLFLCEMCGKDFSQRSNLLRHMMTHTGDKPFPCSICNKKFTLASNLKMHMKTHTGVKPFSCETCGKTFSRSGNLKVHMRKLHS